MLQFFNKLCQFIFIGFLTNLLLYYREIMYFCCNCNWFINSILKFKFLYDLEKKFIENKFLK
jgi:hypothetical protein